MTAAQRWLLAVLLAAAAATAWLYLHTRDIGGFTDGDNTRPRVVITQPRWQIFDAGGNAEKQLSAVRLEQWAGEDGARLLQPRLSLRDSRDRQWKLSAERGVIHDDGRPIVLRDNVRLNQQAAAGGLSANTALLNIAHSGDRLETDSGIELNSGRWHFTADGLRANLGEQRLQLLGKVRGRHE